MSKSTSRRAVLAGAAALPLASLPAIAAAHPDAELLALGRELEEATRTFEAAAIPYEAARARIDAMLPHPKVGIEGPEWDEWRKQHHRALKRRGYRKLYRAWSDAAGKQYEVGEKIAAIPAHTIEGLAVKVDALEAMFSDDPENLYGDLPWLTDDIRRLAGKAVAA
jgi:hypothetical protein